MIAVDDLIAVREPDPSNPDRSTLWRFVPTAPGYVLSIEHASKAFRSFDDAIDCIGSKIPTEHLDASKGVCAIFRLRKPLGTENLIANISIGSQKFHVRPASNRRRGAKKIT